MLPTSSLARLWQAGGATGGTARASLHSSPALLVASAGASSKDGRNKARAETETSSSLAYVSYENPKYEQDLAPLVIQHGLFGRKENFLRLGKQVHNLSRRGVIVPDLRNHGDSPPCANMSIRQMSADLQRLTGQLGVEKASMMGHAAGGRVAMYTALTRPKLVERLVVASSSPLNTPSLMARWQRNRTACSVMAELLDSLSSETQGRLRRGVGECDIGVEFKLVANDRLREVLTDSRERALFLSNLGKVNVASLLERRSADLGVFPQMQDETFCGPCLFITGEREPVWEDDREVRAIRQLFPNSHFVKIPGASHWAHTESTDQFLAAVISFLQTDF